MKTILCPTDFSSNATSAAEYACSLAEKFDARIILFHAYEEPVMIAVEEVPIMEEIKTNIKEAATKKLDDLKKSLHSHFPKSIIITELSSGTGYQETVAAAKKFAADLIVIGTTGSSGIERLFMGSTAKHVIKEAGCPVFCIPRKARFRDIKKIIFATDLENDNISAAITITPFAMKLGAEIIFVFVDNKHLLHEEHDIVNMTQKIKSRVTYPKISGYVANNTSIPKGIEYFSEKYSGDLLVMLTHEKHFPESILNASVTLSVSNKIAMPLLVLKRDDELSI